MSIAPDFVIEQPIGSLDIHDLTVGVAKEGAPVVVAVHAVDVLPLVRSIAATAPPALVPQTALVRRSGPSSTQSPHCASKVPNQLLQIR